MSLGIEDDINTLNTHLYINSFYEIWGIYLNSILFYSLHIVNSYYFVFKYDHITYDNIL